MKKEKYEFDIKFEAKPVKVPIDIKEPIDQRPFMRFNVFMNFGGICTDEEIDQITDIAYKAYLRHEKERKKQ